MLGTIISAIIGGAGGFGGAELVSNLTQLGSSDTSGITGVISGVIGGGALGGLLGHDSDVATGGLNIKQIIGGLAGGAGAGGIVQTVMGMLGGT